MANTLNLALTESVICCEGPNTERWLQIAQRSKRHV